MTWRALSNSPYPAGTLRAAGTLPAHAERRLAHYESTAGLNEFAAAGAALLKPNAEVAMHFVYPAARAEAVYEEWPGRYCSPRHRHPTHVEPSCIGLNSVSGLVSKVWYRIPFNQSELSIWKIPPTGSPTVRPRRDP